MSDSDMPASPPVEAPITAPHHSQQSASGSPWSKVLVLITILAVSGLAVFFAFVWLAKESMVAGKEAMMGIAEAFKPETITQTFVDWHELEAKGTDGNILEVATAEATETFTKKTNLKLFDVAMPLGTTVSEVSVPATYRFHIDLDGEWFLSTDGSRVMVVAPTIQPSLPVAFDTARMRKKTKSGWGRWDGDESLEALERTLTAQLSERAQSPGTISKVREESRLAVAKFVSNWLMSRSHWNDRTFTEIAVVFEDELTGENKVTLSNQPATLKLGETADEPPSPQKVLP